MQTCLCLYPIKRVEIALCSVDGSWQIRGPLSRITKNCHVLTFCFVQRHLSDHDAPSNMQKTVTVTVNNADGNMQKLSDGSLSVVAMMPNATC